MICKENRSNRSLEKNALTKTKLLDMISNNINESNHLCSTSFFTFSWNLNQNSFHSDFSGRESVPVDALFP